MLFDDGDDGHQSADVARESLVEERREDQPDDIDDDWRIISQQQLQTHFHQFLKQLLSEPDQPADVFGYMAKCFADSSKKMSLANENGASFTGDAGHCSFDRHGIAPPLEPPDLVPMEWHSFSKNDMCRRKKLVSYHCFHTGTTTSVKQTTIRVTKTKGYQALVMEADSGEFYVVTSKAQGCDADKVDDPTFIGWVRRYEAGTPFFGDAWDEVDLDVENFLADIASCEDGTLAPFSDEALQNRLMWRELLMRPRPNDKGEWTYVYVAQLDDEEYSLLNKGVRVL